MLKRSRYNFFVDRADGVLAYNARTGVFALLAPNVADILRDDSLPLELADEQDLVEMGFLHDGREVEQIAARFAEQRQLRTPLHVTLLPTLACNLRCPYCFQKESRSARVMSRSTQKATLHCLSRWVAAGRSQVLITWFGGEPLLCKDIVLGMSTELHRVMSAAGKSVV